MEEKIYDIIKEILQNSNYIDGKRDGQYYHTLYLDYNDLKNFDETLMNWFKEEEFVSKEDFYDYLYQYVYEAYEDYESEIYTKIIEEVIEKLQESEIEDIDEDDIRDYIFDLVFIDYDDVFNMIKNIEIKCYLALTNTNEELNYDLGESGSTYLNDEEISYKEFEKLHNSNIFLCNSQGHSLKELYDYYYEKNKTNSKFIKSMAQEISEAYYGGAFVFLFELDLETFLNIKFDNPNLIISKYTTCGLFDWVDGAGGTLDVELEKDIKVPSNTYKFYADEENRYGINDTYGLTSSAWEGGIKIE